jgi:hypothetical protein
MLSGIKLGFAFRHCMVRLVIQSSAVGRPFYFVVSLLGTDMYQVETFFISATLLTLLVAKSLFFIASFLNSILNDFSGGREPNFLI